MIWYFFLPDGRVQEHSWQYPSTDTPDKHEPVADQFAYATDFWLYVWRGTWHTVEKTEDVPKPVRLTALLMGLDIYRED